MTNKLLITGSTGFVGKQLLVKLIEDQNYNINLLNRSVKTQLSSCVSEFTVKDYSSLKHTHECLSDVDTVIHLASRVHVMAETESDPLLAFRKVNVDMTLHIARMAVSAGVRRFIFISSVKVNGEQTKPGRYFSAESIPAPIDAYGISKYEAEIGLKKIASETGLELVIIRPVLVYGPGVKANFDTMMRWLTKGIPLPFGAINNKRSFVAVENLVDLMITCIQHPAADGEVFLVSDGEDMSTSEVLKKLALSLNVKSRLIKVPCVFLNILAGLIGKKKLSQRVCGSLQVDIAKTCAVLNWKPIISTDLAFQKTADHFLSERK